MTMPLARCGEEDGKATLINMDSQGDTKVTVKVRPHPAMQLPSPETAVSLLRDLLLPGSTLFAIARCAVPTQGQSSSSITEYLTFIRLDDEGLNPSQPLKIRGKYLTPLIAAVLQKDVVLVDNGAGVYEAVALQASRGTPASSRVSAILSQTLYNQANAITVFDL